MFCKNDFDMHARPTLGVKWPMCQELKWPMCQESCRSWTKVGVLIFDNLFDLLVFSGLMQRSNLSYQTERKTAHEQQSLAVTIGDPSVLSSVTEVKFITLRVLLHLLRRYDLILKTTPVYTF